MKNLKLKLTLAMVGTTLILFLITFFIIRFYQERYIFDKAILSLENELKYYESYDESLMENKDRFFNVEALFIEEDYEDYLSRYGTKQEKYFNDLYKSGKLTYDKIERKSTSFGDYYILMTKLSNQYFFQEAVPYNDGKSTPEDLEDVEDMTVIFYTDITLSANIVRKVNIIFFIMLIIIVIVEGMVGVYLGKKFEDSQSKLKHFFQNASHELKTPLMSIQGYAEGMKTGLIDDTEMASQVIIKKSQKMKLLVDEILNISKLDTKEYVLKNEEFNLVDIIEESVENFKSLREEKEISLTLNIESQDSIIRADSLQIYKAVNTVIDNAFKYAKTRVAIGLKADKKMFFISIFNDGDPVDEENAKHIFDRFYSKNDFSTGIGLAMAKEILTLSKGRISLNNVEEGVLFEICLPKK